MVGIQISSVVFLSVILFTSSFAFGASITLNIDEKPDSNKIVVSGTNDVSKYTYLHVFDPEGERIWNNTYSGNKFETKISTTNDKWNKPGLYKIMAGPCPDTNCYWDKSLTPYIISESFYHEGNPVDQVAGGGVAPVLDQGLIIGILTLAIIVAIAAFVIWYWKHRGRKPEPPANLTATAAAGPIISLEWEDPTETNGDPIIGYRIVRSEDQDFSRCGYFNDERGNLTFSVHDCPTQSLDDENPMTLGTTYYYKVSVVNKHGISDWSNIASAVAADVPDPPENLHATEITKQSITIAWDPSPAAETYELQREKTRLEIAYVDNEYKDAGLHPGAKYTFKVIAKNDFGESEPAVLTVTTEEEEVEEEVKEEVKKRKFFTSYSLDDEQLDAVQYDYDKPLMVRSGPGSGKTRVVKERIKDIVLEQGVDPNKILCLSFSKAAQQTMLDRFKDDVDLKGKLEDIIKKREENDLEALSEEQVGGMNEVLRNISIGENSVRTIHSLGLQISPGKKISNDEFKQFQNEINADDFKKISYKYPINYEGNPNFKQKLSDGVSAWKREALSLDDLENHIKNITRKWEAGDYRGRKDENEIQDKIEKYKELSKYFKKYQEFLGEKGKIDFDDMVMNSIEKLKNDEKFLEAWQEKYDHVIVDEFQDNNYLQTEIARLLSPKGHVTVVGDEDQCIYVFQGAHVENFEHFKDHFKHFNVEEKALRTNYRSTEEIVDKSSKLMDNVKDRVTKDLIAHRNEKGNLVVMIECEEKKDEFDYICKKIMELQESISPPLSLKDFAVFFRKNRDIYDFMNFLKNNPSPDIRNLQDANIKSIHSAKGEEYRVVFVAHVEDGNIPVSFQERDFEVPVVLQKFKQDLDDSTAHEREERRVLYVAMTRAKDDLFLTYHTDDIDENISRSEFLNDIKIKHEKYENEEQSQ